MTDYVAAFDKLLIESDESKKPLEESMGNWLRVFKFPSIERGSYDRLECTAKHQVYPLLGQKVVGNITSADIQKLLNHWMNEGYAYTTVKKVYNLLTDYFRYLTQQELITKNPMTAAPMIKKANFLAAQGKENRPTFETVTTFTADEIERFKAESFRTWSNGERIYQQASAYTLMFNTGLRTGEVLGLGDHGVVLCTKGHSAAERNHRGVRAMKEPTICAAIGKEKEEIQTRKHHGKALRCIVVLYSYKRKKRITAISIKVFS